MGLKLFNTQSGVTEVVPRLAEVEEEVEDLVEAHMEISDEQGRELWLGAIRPGRMHDATAVRTEASRSSCGCTRT
ncbi:hypothetical protein ABZ725_46980 [Streptomyces sp. NPDC006872]|uniref:hypothetical protein n=1 Tax=Streptomyces sp. NPDC006872 TaxID=3155720 RepID=UPI0033ED6A0A